MPTSSCIPAEATQSAEHGREASKQLPAAATERRRSVMQRLFGGELASTVVCGGCGHVSAAVESFMCGQQPYILKFKSPQTLTLTSTLALTATANPIQTLTNCNPNPDPNKVLLAGTCHCRCGGPVIAAQQQLLPHRQLPRMWSMAATARARTEKRRG